MQSFDINTELKMVEQLAVALQHALRGTSAQARSALNHKGFSKTRRVAAQKMLFILVGAIRKTTGKPS